MFRDGVITWLQVESGQVVAAGQPLVKLARIDEKEVLINIPEHRINKVRIGQDVVVVLWAEAERRYKGRIREIAEAADPASRTYDVKVTLLEGLKDTHLGMTATVELPLSTNRQISIPLSAVFVPLNEPGPARVWQVNETNNTVASVPVNLGEPIANECIVVSGLAEGQLIVSAGVHRLKEGQAVRIMEQDPPNAKSAGQRASKRSHEKLQSGRMGIATSCFYRLSHGASAAGRHFRLFPSGSAGGSRFYFQGYGRQDYVSRRDGSRSRISGN